MFSPPPRLQVAASLPRFLSVTPPPCVASIHTTGRSRTPPVRQPLSVLFSAQPLKFHPTRSASVPPRPSEAENAQPALEDESMLNKRQLPHDKREESPRKLSKTTSQKSLKRSASMRSQVILKPSAPKSPRRPIFNSLTALSWTGTLRRSESRPMRSSSQSSRKSTSIERTPDQELAKSAKMLEKYRQDHDKVKTTLEAAEKAAEDGLKLMRYLTHRTEKLANEEGCFKTHPRREKFSQRFEALEKEKNRASELLEDAYQRVRREKHRLDHTKANVEKQKATSLQAISQIRECHEDDGGSFVYTPAMARPRDSAACGARVYETATMPVVAIGTCNPRLYVANWAGGHALGCADRQLDVRTGKWACSPTTGHADRPLYARTGNWACRQATGHAERQLDSRTGNWACRQATGHAERQPAPALNVSNRMNAFGTRAMPSSLPQAWHRNTTPSPNSQSEVTWQNNPVSSAAKQRLLRKINSIGSLVEPRRSSRAIGGKSDLPAAPIVENNLRHRHRAPGSTLDRTNHGRGRSGQSRVGIESEVAMRDIIQTAEKLHDKWNALPPELQARLHLHCVPTYRP